MEQFTAAIDKANAEAEADNDKAPGKSDSGPDTVEKMRAKLREMEALEQAKNAPARENEQDTHS
jgi:hypothetical protein